MFDTNLTKHLAELSKINFTDDEIAVISNEMSEIISLMDTVTEYNIDETFASADPVQFSDLRKDEIKDSFPREEILKNAKGKSDTCFKVPKVV
ncbi:MAG: Asp-tRNA(Asn)/Glu-tRNA(Gln) amidotransferase subunit GatC [Oscillospiraceae bacterium]|nr:Asp-tRNA(Asn)/Glu-tRNA(Gln) amidotransferase subunit GatC [Oscillospiraceae bacterium]